MLDTGVSRGRKIGRKDSDGESGRDYRNSTLARAETKRELETGLPSITTCSYDSSEDIERLNERRSDTLSMLQSSMKGVDGLVA